MIQTPIHSLSWLMVIAQISDDEEEEICGISREDMPPKGEHL